jgi:hypothetical protein
MSDLLRGRIVCHMRRYRKFSDLVALFENRVAFECRSAPFSALSFPRRRHSFPGPFSRFTLIHAASGGLYITVSWDPLPATYRRGYASVARLEEIALQPSQCFTIFANRTTSNIAICLQPENFLCLAFGAFTASHDDHACNVRAKIS